MLGYGQYTREGLFNGGIGVTSINDETFLTLSLHPEISLDKFGVGLNIDFLFNTKTNKLRSKDWNKSYDYFRLIRYIRYGWKGDKFYTRLGTLYAARLGHGFIMNYYTNESEWDERKNGLELDIDWGKLGFESMTSNLGRMEIVGGRAYARPFQDNLSMPPILKNITFGATIVIDVDPDRDKDPDDNVSVYGGDIELPLVNNDILETIVYADYAKINTRTYDYGSGKAVGMGFKFKNLLGLAYVETRLERRWLGKEFLPSYFNAFYEIERYSPILSIPGIRKSDLLLLKTENTKGFFGELYGRILGAVHIIGNFQRLDNHPKSGILHLGVSATKGLHGIAFQAAYDKQNIETFRDTRTLDNRSVVRVSLGYKIKPYLIFFMDYIWSYELNEQTNRYVPQERYHPRITFNYHFSL